MRQMYLYPLWGSKARHICQHPSLGNHPFESLQKVLAESVHGKTPGWHCGYRIWIWRQHIRIFSSCAQQKHLWHPVACMCTCFIAGRIHCWVCQGTLRSWGSFDAMHVAGLLCWSLWHDCLRSLVYCVTGNFTLQQLFIPGINFGITLHSLYRKNISAQVILLYITLSWLQPLSCTSILFSLHYIKNTGGKLISYIKNGFQNLKCNNFRSAG